MGNLKSALQLNVLITMAVGDCDFKHLLMRDPMAATHEYNRRAVADAGQPCNLPRQEVEMLQRVAGTTEDFRQFCLSLLNERDQLERQEEQRQHLKVLVPGNVTYLSPESRKAGRRLA